MAVLKTVPRSCSMPVRFQNAALYISISAKGLKKKTTAEWIEIFDLTDVPERPHQTLDQIMEAPLLKNIGFFEKVEHPSEGKIIKMKLSNKQARADFRFAPRVGEQTAEILREAGLSNDDIAALVKEDAAVDGGKA
jgi:crotonobetainyl-CoA:carnitine CoA-transferase CaiB-like acyl-CoA transferase